MEAEADQPAVYDINHAAFGQPAEANLVEQLRHKAHPFISLVAEVDEEVCGHILFTPVELDNGSDLELMGLAPMAVAPKCQNTGVGSALVKAGLAACVDQGIGAVVVLGHPDYYPRFGFKPASTLGIGSTYDVPDEVFMALELIPGYLDAHEGTVRYHCAFDEVE